MNFQQLTNLFCASCAFHVFFVLSEMFISSCQCCEFRLLMEQIDAQSGLSMQIFIVFNYSHRQPSQRRLLVHKLCGKSSSKEEKSRRLQLNFYAICSINTRVRIATLFHVGRLFFSLLSSFECLQFALCSR